MASGSGNQRITLRATSPLTSVTLDLQGDIGVCVLKLSTSYSRVLQARGISPTHATAVQIFGAFAWRKSVSIFSKSGWGATRIVRGSAPKTFFASASTTPPDTISALLTLASQVTIQWIFCLYHAGSEYQHGESWLSATWEGQTVLAFIPKYGMYSFQDRKYWVLSLYPFERDATYGLPTSSFSTAFKPRKALLPVPSAKLSDVRPMWPSMRSEKDGWITFRFVPL